MKTKINKLKKELAILKSDNLKKTEEIKKRKKDIIIAINRESTFGNLKEENIISKLKDNYDNTKNKTIKKMKNRNECDRLSFKKRITKISSSKRRPNSSFGVPSSTNYTMNSLCIKKDKSLNLRKSQYI